MGGVKIEMCVKFVVVAIVWTLLILSAVPNRSLAKPSRTKSEAEEGQMVYMAEEKEEEQERTTAEEASAENRQRQKELSRDTFLRLNSNPRGETEEEIGKKSANGERRRQRQMSQAEESYRSPLGNGDTLMTLSSDVTLMEGTSRMNNCRGDLFKHKIHMPGCQPKTIVNRFCHGNCASFYIPRLRSKKLKATFQSCAACVPTETELVQVPLLCPGNEEVKHNRTVVRVKRCACRNIALEEEGQEDEENEMNGQRWETETL